MQPEQSERKFVKEILKTFQKFLKHTDWWTMSSKARIQRMWWY